MASNKLILFTSVSAIAAVSSLWMLDSEKRSGDVEPNAAKVVTEGAAAKPSSAKEAIALAKAEIAAISAEQTLLIGKAPPVSVPAEPVKEIAPHAAPRVLSSAEDAAPRLFFSELRGLNGDKLAAEVEFIRQSGELAIFQPAKGHAISLKIERLHPDVLGFVGIDIAETARNKQRKEARQRAQKVAARQHAVATRIAEKKRAEAAAIRRSKIDNEKIELLEHDTVGLLAQASIQEKSAIQYSHAAKHDIDHRNAGYLNAWLQGKREQWTGCVP